MAIPREPIRVINISMKEPVTAIVLVPRVSPEGDVELELEGLDGFDPPPIGPGVGVSVGWGVVVGVGAVVGVWITVGEGQPNRQGRLILPSSLSPS